MGCWRLARWHACSRCLLCGERNLQSGELRSAGVCSVFETVSVAVAVTLQPTERTLTDTEIEAVSARIVDAVARRTGAVLRT